MCQFANAPQATYAASQQDLYFFEPVNGFKKEPKAAQADDQQKKNLYNLHCF
jgi:hypothetical protein